MNWVKKLFKSNLGDQTKTTDTTKEQIVENFKDHTDNEPNLFFKLCSLIVLPAFQSYHSYPSTFFHITLRLYQLD